MKLIRFTIADSPNPCFGVVVRDQAVPFALLQNNAGKTSPHLAESRGAAAGAGPAESFRQMDSSPETEDQAMPEVSDFRGGGGKRPAGKARAGERKPTVAGPKGPLKGPA